MKDIDRRSIERLRDKLARLETKRITESEFYTDVESILEFMSDDFDVIWKEHISRLAFTIYDVKEASIVLDKGVLNTSQAHEMSEAMRTFGELLQKYKSLS